LHNLSTEYQDDDDSPGTDPNTDSDGPGLNVIKTFSPSSLILEQNKLDRLFREKIFRLDNV
jgi:hypothetical protein